MCVRGKRNHACMCPISIDLTTRTVFSAIGPTTVSRTWRARHQHITRRAAAILRPFGWGGPTYYAKGRGQPATLWVGRGNRAQSESDENCTSDGGSRSVEDEEARGRRRGGRRGVAAANLRSFGGKRCERRRRRCLRDRGQPAATSLRPACSQSGRKCGHPTLLYPSRPGAHHGHPLGGARPRSPGASPEIP